MTVFIYKGHFRRHDFGRRCNFPLRFWIPSPLVHLKVCMKKVVIFQIFCTPISNTIFHLPHGLTFLWRSSSIRSMTPSLFIHTDDVSLMAGDRKSWRPVAPQRSGVRDDAGWLRNWIDKRLWRAQHPWYVPTVNATKLHGFWVFAWQGPELISILSTTKPFMLENLSITENNVSLRQGNAFEEILKKKREKKRMREKLYFN